MIFYDTETCGLHGPIVLVQYAKDDEPINLYCPWKNKVNETIELYEWLTQDDICGFNLAFDHFHLCQQYTTLLRLRDLGLGDELLEDCINEYAFEEKEARFGSCIKPKACCDLLLHARKSHYQNLMERDDIRIKRVPTVLAEDLAKKLDELIPLDRVYFARKSDPDRRWGVYDCYDEFGDAIPEFKDVVLKFAPSSALKALAKDALGYSEEDVAIFSEIDLPKKLYPIEQGWAPFALAPYQMEANTGHKYWVYPGEDKESYTDWKGKWPSVVTHHISHWCFNETARKYAKGDVKYTRELYHHFGSPEPGDDDSELACMVGASRWRGYAIDVEGIKAIRDESKELVEGSKINFNSPAVCKKYLQNAMSETERITVAGSTKSLILEEVAKWTIEEVCSECSGMGCDQCEEGLVQGDISHPAAERAKHILDFRHAKKEIDLYDKLLATGRFHASFNVIGTLSSRMSGSDGLNPQAINKDKKVRSKFPLADGELSVLSGGDFESFEVVLMDAAYGDKKMREELQEGVKIHAVFGSYVFAPLTYEEVKATSGLPGEQDKYKRAKQGVFALAYGGEENTLVTRCGITRERAREAYDEWCKKYKEWAEERKKIFDRFCSMRQPNGIGSKVQWHEPDDYIESLTGFRRYFTLENKICKALYELAQSPPKQWQQYKIKVVRRDREQTASGALRSALFACAFQIQAANTRAAANHVIQSTGAILTKRLQRKIWDFQPEGSNNWYVQPLNIHDEIMTPHKPGLENDLRNKVDEFIEQHKEQVPLIKIDWSDNVENWAEK